MGAGSVPQDRDYSILRIGSYNGKATYSTIPCYNSSIIRTLFSQTQEEGITALDDQRQPKQLSLVRKGPAPSRLESESTPKENQIYCLFDL